MRREFEEQVTFCKLNFLNDDFSAFDSITDIETLVITVGFGRVALFEDLIEVEVKSLMNVDFNSIVRIVKKYQ